MTQTSFATDFVAAAKANGGATRTLHGNTPQTGYMVSVPGPEKVLKVLTAASVNAFTRTHAEKLSFPGAYVGAWLDTTTGLWYLDVSVNVRQRNQALRLGRQWSQLAVWDVENVQEVRVPNFGPASKRK
jgi:hypothetical protein